MWRSGSSVSFQWDVPKQTWPHYHVGSESNRKSSKSDFHPKVLCLARSNVEDETRNMNRIYCNENCFSILDENNDRDGAEWWPWIFVKLYLNNNIVFNSFLQIKWRMWTVYSMRTLTVIALNGGLEVPLSLIQILYPGWAVCPKINYRTSHKSARFNYTHIIWFGFNQTIKKP